MVNLNLKLAEQKEKSYDGPPPEAAATGTLTNLPRRMLRAFKRNIANTFFFFS